MIMPCHRGIVRLDERGRVEMTDDASAVLPDQIERAVRANQAMHARLAERYDQVEPHFRPENQAKVRARIEVLAAGGRGRLLDVGCGTGFIIRVAGDVFDAVDGVDATPEMLARIDVGSGRVTLHQGVVENLPFDDRTFDMVTAYSFLDHLADPVVALEEAFRVLRPGGVLYADLLPNRSYWKAVHAAAASDPEIRANYDPLVAREVREVARHEEALAETYGTEVAPGSWDDVEPVKSRALGFDAAELRTDLLRVGYQNVEVHHEWFLGEGVVLHGDGPEAAAAIAQHLRRLDPIASSAFKYLWVAARRPAAD